MRSLSFLLVVSLTFAQPSRSSAYYQLPDVTLRNSSGDKVSVSRELSREQPVMLQFIFTTCPTICPVMSSVFSALQQELGAERKQLRLISISIDPEYDTPARLKQYAEKFKAQDGWSFWTGDRDDILAVLKAFDAYRGNKMQHEPFTYLRLNPSSPWIRFDGLMSASQLAAEYRRLKER